MGAVRAGVAVELVRRLCAGLGIVNAVETGTYGGDSAETLASVVGEVWSVELSADLYGVAKQRLAGREKIHLVHGSSTTALPGILLEGVAPAVFWLDGHWSGGETSLAETECPVIGELVAIDGWANAERSCLLVDDARLFLGPPPPPHDRSQWPALIDVVDQLRTVHPRYVTVLEDVIIAGPAEA